MTRSSMRRRILHASFALGLPLALASCGASEPKIFVLNNFHVAEHYEFRARGDHFQPGNKVIVSIINAPGIGTKELGTVTVTKDGEAGLVHTYRRTGNGPECGSRDKSDVYYDDHQADSIGTRPITVVMRQDKPYAVASAGGYIPDCDWDQ